MHCVVAAVLIYNRSARWPLSYNWAPRDSNQPSKCKWSALRVHVASQCHQNSRFFKEIECIPGTHCALLRSYTEWQPCHPLALGAPASHRRECAKYKKKCWERQSILSKKNVAWNLTVPGQRSQYLWYLCRGLSRRKNSATAPGSQTTHRR